VTSRVGLNVYMSLDTVNGAGAVAVGSVVASSFNCLKTESSVFALL
jgi:hypothetical protein